MDEIAAMEAIQNMVDTDGWVMFQAFITERIEDHKRQLMTCPLEDVLEHRTKAEALQSVFLYVEETIERGREAMQREPP